MKAHSQSATQRIREPTILFDGDCSLCSRQARNLEAFSRHSVQARPLQEVEIDIAGLSPGELRREIKLILPNGRVYGGAEALVQLVRRGNRVLGFIVSAYYFPPFRYVADRAYGIVARHRYRLFGRKEPNCDSGSCEVRYGSEPRARGRSRR